MGKVSDHVGANAKAYTGGVAALISQAFSEHVANILMWGITLLGVVAPEAVQTSIRYVLVSAVTGAAIYLVGNRGNGNEEKTQ